MALEFSSEISIDAPAQLVFEAMTDPGHYGQWMQGLIKIEQLTDGDFGLGTEFKETRKFYGREAVEHFEVVDFQAPERLGLRVDGTKGDSKKGEYRFEYTFSPTAGGSGTLLKMEGQIDMPGRLARLMGKLFMGTFKKACLKDLEAMKTYLEGKKAA